MRDKDDKYVQLSKVLSSMKSLIFELMKKDFFDVHFLIFFVEIIYEKNIDEIFEEKTFRNLLNKMKKSI